MTIEIKEVKTQADRKAFVNVQFEIYKGSEYWVPPLKKDEINAINPEKNPAHKYCDAKYWLAYKNGKCCGRIGALINHHYNEKVGEKMGRFNRLEFFDDRNVFEALMKTAEDWLKQKEMKGIHGPLGFSNLDPQGLLVDGFDHLPSVASVYHHPYYFPYLEDYGFEKENDWVEFRLTVSDIPEKGLKMVEMVKLRYGLKTLTFTNKNDIIKYLEKMFAVFNKAFAELPYMNELNSDMIYYYKKKYSGMINPKYVKLVEDKDSNLVAFIIGLPSLSRAMQKARGKLFPFGIFHLMKAMKNPEVIDLALTGVLPEAQSTGAPALFFSALQQQAIEKGVKYMETTGMFETNTKAIAFWKNYEHIQHKRKRCYKRIFTE